MKISKIACVFLLGAGLSVTSLFANLSDENEEYMKAKNGQTNQDTDYEKVVEAIKKLKSYDSGVLAKWSGDDQNDPNKNDQKTNKEISDQLDHIKELLDLNQNVFLKTKDGKGELQVKDSNGNKKITLTLKGDNGDKVEEKDFSLDDLKKGGTKHDLVKQMFDPKYKALWEELIAKFEEFHQKNQQERIRKAALNFAKSNIGEDDLINAYAIGQKDLLNALKSEITKQEADVEAKQKDLEKAKSAAEAKLNETKGKLNIPDLSSENLEAKENQLASDKGSISGANKNNADMTSNDMDVYAKQLKKALTDGIKPTEEVSNDKIEEALKADQAKINAAQGAPDPKAKATELDKIKDKMDELIDKATQALQECETENGKVKTAEGVLDTANKNAKEIKDKLDSFKKVAAGPSVLKKTLDALDPNKDGSAANDLKKSEAELPPLQKSLDDEVKKVDGSKVTLKGTTAKDIQDQATAIDKAKQALTEAKALQNGEKIQKQKDALKKAIQAGIPIKDETGAKNLTEAEINSKEEDAIKKIVDGNGAVGNDGALKSIKDAEEALKKAKEAAQKVKDQEEEIDSNKSQVEELKKGLSLASNARLEAIKNLANLDPKSDQILSTLSELISQSDVVQDIMSNADTKDLIQGIQELHSTLDESSKTIGKSYSTDVVIFNQSLSTNTRLAKLSNPFNENLALAYAIKNVEGEKFADNGNSLSSVIREYTNRYNYDNNLWGNVFGGKAKVKNSPNTNLYGFTLGYDKAFDNTIVGGFFTLGKSQSNSDLLKNKANIYSFGVYSRSYFGENELDAKFAYGVAKSKLEISNSLIGLNKGDFDGKFFDISVDYGRVFDLSNAKFIKPIIGLEYTNLKNDSFNANGGVDIKFAKTSAKTLSAKLATEFRVYDDNGDYFYITPGIERELSKSVDDMNIRFANANKDIKFDADKKKYTYFAFKAGSEFKVTNNLSTNINFGVKARSKNQFYNGTLGLSYKF